MRLQGRTDQRTTTTIVEEGRTLGGIPPGADMRPHTNLGAHKVPGSFVEVEARTGRGTAPAHALDCSLQISAGFR